MTSDEALAKARHLFSCSFGENPASANYKWDMAVEFAPNPYRAAGEMWMVFSSENDRIYAFVDEEGGDLLGVIQRKTGRKARHIE